MGGPGLASTRTSAFWTSAESDGNKCKHMETLSAVRHSVSANKPPEKSLKAPVKSPPTNTHLDFLQARCPSSRPTNSVKALKGKYHIPWTCLPQAHLRVFQLCLWPLIAPVYLGEGLPCLSSAFTSLGNTTEMSPTTDLWVALSDEPRTDDIKRLGHKCR